MFSRRCMMISEIVAELIFLCYLASELCAIEGVNEEMPFSIPSVVTRNSHYDVIRLGVTISPTSSHTENRCLLKIVEVYDTRHDRESEHIIGHHN
jgi:hypothetical protein